MISVFGMVLIIAALVTTLAAGGLLLWGMRKKQERFIFFGKQVLLGSTLLLLLSLVLLLLALAMDQFQIIAVAQYSSMELPFYLKLTALWAGQEGSILLWAFLQTSFAWLIAKQVEGEERLFQGWAAVFLSFIAAFFIAITLFFSNPFQAVSPVPLDGQGMNPLLRHPGMIFHPPLLYLGYVGLAVPFAYALSALIVGRVGRWIKPVRSWLLISWIALGLGIFLGARWAYDVLGWGGYWGWDAVENAGLMPWLTATALLHGLDMQKRGKGFKVWNVSLAVLSFALVLFGTFTTRSGLIESVHAFSISESGPYFLAMIGLVLVGSLVLMIAQRDNFGELIYPEKVLSREGAAFFTLLLIVLITLSILLGTLLPTLTGGVISASAAWFNRVVGPQLGALVLLMGICPLLGRWFSKKGGLWRSILPLVGAILMTGLALYLRFLQAGAIIGLVITGFAGGAALAEIGGLVFLKESGVRVRWQGLGGHLVHMGVVLMAVGVIGTQMYAWDETYTMTPGDTVQIGEYELFYEDLYQETTGDHLDTWASITVYRDSAYLTTLTPTILYYPDYQQTMAEPAIRAGWAEDLYLVMFQWDSSGQVSLAAMINPLSSFLWLGGFLLIFGGAIAWWPRNPESLAEGKKTAVWRKLAAGIVLVLIVVIFAVLWGDTLGLSGRSGRPLPGTAAPDFTVEAISGESISLSDQIGQVTLVHFWGTWCDQCEEEMLMLESVWGKYEAQDVLFIGIAMDDSLNAVEKFTEVHQISFPLIVEAENSITGLYGVNAVPETFIVDQAGLVAYYHIGAVKIEQLKTELESLLDN